MFNEEIIENILKKEDFFRSCKIKRIEILNRIETPLSVIYRIHLEYHTKTTIPTYFILKMFKMSTRSDLIEKYGHNEVVFYEKIALLNNNYPIVKCYNTNYLYRDNYYLLLEDKTSFCINICRPILPSKTNILKSINSLFSLHNTWLNHQLLGHEIGVIYNEITIKEYVRMHELIYLNFIYNAPSLLDCKLKNEIEFILNNLSKVYLRLTNRLNQTLIHGDAHLWNFLYPIDIKADKAIFIDWQNWKICIPTNDLAYMLSLHLNENDFDFEKKMIKYYFNMLKANYIHYAWEDFDFDYKLSIIKVIFTPFWQFYQNVDSSIWTNYIKKIPFLYRMYSLKEYVSNIRNI